MSAVNGIIGLNLDLQHSLLAAGDAAFGHIPGLYLPAISLPAEAASAIPPSLARVRRGGSPTLREVEEVADAHTAVKGHNQPAPIRSYDYWSDSVRQSVLAGALACVNNICNVPANQMSKDMIYLRKIGTVNHLDIIKGPVNRAVAPRGTSYL